MKKQLAKAPVVCLALVLIIQCCLFASSEPIFAENATDNYIVIANSDETAQKIRNQHNINSENGEAISVNLSEREVAQLEEDKNIVCVEKDFTIENEADAGWDMVKPAIDGWNMKTINAENTTTNAKVKVAILDSGIDYTEDIVVKERRNFITDDPVTTPLYEDTSGHGTSVASIVAGKGVESNVNGVNGNIELYSARVLDNNKKAPMSRVIEAIYWAMEKDVNIINISFGTEIYSEALKTAIDAAINQGILVIAAAGNYGNSSIDYPAAFDSVVAVGAINAAGEISDFSSTNEGVDLLAPGEAVSVQANFGEGLTLSGTSLAAPHVAGVAACLWSRDLTKPSTFIKALLKLSAKKMTVAGSGYGLVDYERALQIYGEVANQFEAIADENANPPAKENPPAEVPTENEGIVNDDVNLEIPTEESPIDDQLTDNNNEETDTVQAMSTDTGYDVAAALEGDQETSVETSSTPDTSAVEEEVDSQVFEVVNGTEFEERAIQEIQVRVNSGIVEDYSDPVVTGSWGSTVHQAYGANTSMKAGAIISDKSESEVKGMTNVSEFHGFSWHADTDSGLNTGTCNYVANYRYLVLVANKVGASGSGSYTSVTNSSVSGLSSTCYGKLKTGIGNIKKTSQYINAANKKAFLLGVAMHTATDAFAHSAFTQQLSGSYPWVRIKHGGADEPSVAPRRVQMAYAVEKNVVSRYNGNRSMNAGNDFHDDTGNCYVVLIGFRQNKLMTFAQAVGVTNATKLSNFKLVQTGSK